MSQANIMIRASAGSGKTFQLSNRYLSLLQQGVPAERILAVTFTRKAAGEIFDRIVLRLAQAAQDSLARQELATVLQCELSEERCCELLTHLLGALHRLRIGTLDSFFAKLAGTCSLELGLPWGWSMVEQHVDNRLRSQAVFKTLQNNAQQILTLLLLLTKGNAKRSVGELILGKVTELYDTYRETQANAWKKLNVRKQLTLLEFDNLIAALESYPLTGAQNLKARTADLQRAMQGDWKEFISKGMSGKVAQGETTFSKKPIPTDLVSIYEPLVQHAQAILINQLAAQNEAAYELLHAFHEHYSALKLTTGSLQFNDITLLLSKICNADAESTSFRLDSRIDHLLLDEFQDTSLAQWQVLRPLAHRITSQSQNASFFCVGDVKQAIYGWRGGLAELFHAVETELPRLQLQSLNQSFRSSPIIMETVNRIFENLHLHPHLDKIENAVRGWQKTFESHTTAKKQLPGFAILETAPHVEDDEEDSNEAFFEFVVDRIEQQYQTATGYSIGVITRTNKSLGELIYRLRRRGIPASEEGKNALLDSTAVEVILSLVQLADFPNDSVAYFHVAHSPLAPYFEMEQKYHFFAASKLAAKLRRELLESGYGAAISQWATALAQHCDSRDRSRLQQLIDLAYAYQPESTLRPSNFMEYVQQSQIADPNSATVRVMTVHQSKGLEFDIVFLPDLEKKLRSQTPSFVVSRPSAGDPIDHVCHYANEDVQKLLPKSIQKVFAESLANEIYESLCVLYVAITRAVHALHMIIKAPNENEKTLPSSYSGFLRMALTNDPTPRTGVLFTQGDPQWFTSASGKSVPVNTPQEIVSPNIQLAPPLETRKRGLQRESPSQLEGNAQVRLATLFELNNAARQNALQRGTAIHAFFEQIIWLQPLLPSESQFINALQQQTDLLGVTMEQRIQWLREFQQMLQLPGVQQLLTQESYVLTWPKTFPMSATSLELNVLNEHPFAVLEETRLMQGRLDRLIYIKDAGKLVAVDVLDYKTDQLSNNPGHTLNDRVEHYRPQIEAYRTTLASLTELPAQQIFAGLLFVQTGTLVRL